MRSSVSLVRLDPVCTPPPPPWHYICCTFYMLIYTYFVHIYFVVMLWLKDTFLILDSWFLILSVTTCWKSSGVLNNNHSNVIIWYFMFTSRINRPFNSIIWFYSIPEISTLVSINIYFGKSGWSMGYVCRYRLSFFYTPAIGFCMASLKMS